MVEVLELAIRGQGRDKMIDWDMANTDASQWVKQHDFDLTYASIDISPEQEQRLKQELINFIEGSDFTVLQLGKRLADVFGIEDAATIAVTEVTRAYAEGNLAAWRADGFTEGKEWSTANDELVCQICGPLDSQVVALNAEFKGGFNGPPAHPG